MDIYSKNIRNMQYSTNIAYFLYTSDDKIVNQVPGRVRSRQTLLSYS